MSLLIIAIAAVAIGWFVFPAQVRPPLKAVGNFVAGLFKKKA